jgi:hypothetical protein
MSTTVDADYDFDMPRIGGKYRISHTAYQNLQSRQSTALSRKLMSWIIEQHLSGNPCPRVTTDVLKEIENSRQLNFGERVKRLFQLAMSKNFQPSDAFRISGIVDDAYKSEMANLSDWLELDESQIGGFFQLTEQLGLTRHASNYVYLTAKGFERLDELQSSNTRSTQAFIAMWFEPKLREVCDLGIEPAIRAAGYSPMRIDKKEHINKIDDEIIAEIRRSRFVVADFTCQKITNESQSFSVPRGGVYFEAGFAMGIGIPVIWTCRKDLIGDVHFDTRQFSHVVWETPDELRRSLYNRIRATIGEVQGAPGLPAGN